MSLAGMLVDMEALLKATRKEPETVHALMTFVTDQLIAYGRALLAAGLSAHCQG